MKVICIDSSSDKDAFLIPGVAVIEGEIYTVLREHEYSLNKFGVVEHIPVYELVERPSGFGYAKSRFLPVSDIDETTFERNYNTQTV